MKHIMICDVVILGFWFFVLCLNRDMVGKVIVVTGGNKGIGFQVQNQIIYFLQ